MPRPAIFGETLARLVDLRIAAPVTNTAAITAIPAADRCDGLIVLETTNGSPWWFDADSTAAAGPTCLVPDAGSGRWLALGSVAAGAGMPKMMAVRNATTGALGAYTRTGNVILANANGALGAIDGVTNVVGDRILLKNGAAGADNGPYRVDAVGAAGAKFQLTRVGEADASAEVVAGMLVFVSEGTANGDEWWFLSTNDPIVLNTTSLTFTQVPQAADVTSLETRFSTADSSLTVVRSSGDSSLTLITSSIETRLSTAEVTRSSGDSSVTLITSSIETRLSTEEAQIDTLRPGVPMQNRLRMLGAPGAIVEGNTVVIGADTYEFRASTPPAGGTAGRIWVYQGADSAASRANFINAVNNVTDAPNITYDGAVTEFFFAQAGITLGDVVIASSSAVGSATLIGSSTATACSETLATATDIWDNATCQYGRTIGTKGIEVVTVTLGAEEMAKGTANAFFTFTPASCLVINRSRPQNEAFTITGSCVTLALAGGASPNNQSGDVIDFVAFDA